MKLPLSQLFGNSRKHLTGVKKEDEEFTKAVPTGSPEVGPVTPEEPSRDFLGGGLSGGSGGGDSGGGGLSGGGFDDARLPRGRNPSDALVAAGGLAGIAPLAYDTDTETPDSELPAEFNSYQTNASGFIDHLKESGFLQELADIGGIQKANFIALALEDQKDQDIDPEILVSDLKRELKTIAPGKDIPFYEAGAEDAIEQKLTGVDDETKRQILARAKDLNINIYGDPKNLARARFSVENNVASYEDWLEDRIGNVNTMYATPQNTHEYLFGDGTTSGFTLTTGEGKKELSPAHLSDANKLVSEYIRQDLVAAGVPEDLIQVHADEGLFGPDYSIVYTDEKTGEQRAITEGFLDYLDSAKIELAGAIGGGIAGAAAGGALASRNQAKHGFTSFAKNVVKSAGVGWRTAALPWVPLPVKGYAFVVGAAAGMVWHSFLQAAVSTAIGRVTGAIFGSSIATTAGNSVDNILAAHHLNQEWHAGVGIEKVTGVAVSSLIFDLGIEGVILTGKATKQPIKALARIIHRMGHPETKASNIVEQIEKIYGVTNEKATEIEAKLSKLVAYKAGKDGKRKKISKKDKLALELALSNPAVLEGLAAGSPFVRGTLDFIQDGLKVPENVKGLGANKEYTEKLAEAVNNVKNQFEDSTREAGILPTTFDFEAFIETKAKVITKETSTIETQRGSQLDRGLLFKANEELAPHLEAYSKALNTEVENITEAFGFKNPSLSSFKASRDKFNTTIESAETGYADLTKRSKLVGKDGLEASLQLTSAPDAEELLRKKIEALTTSIHKEGTHEVKAALLEIKEDVGSLAGAGSLRGLKEAAEQLFKLREEQVTLSGIKKTQEKLKKLHPSKLTASQKLFLKIDGEDHPDIAKFLNKEEEVSTRAKPENIHDALGVERKEGDELHAKREAAKRHQKFFGRLNEGYDEDLFPGIKDQQDSYTQAFDAVQPISDLNTDSFRRSTKELSSTLESATKFEDLSLSEKQTLWNLLTNDIKKSSELGIDFTKAKPSFLRNLAKTVATNADSRATDKEVTYLELIASTILKDVEKDPRAKLELLEHTIGILKGGRIKKKIDVTTSYPKKIKPTLTQSEEKQKSTSGASGNKLSFGDFQDPSKHLKVDGSYKTYVKLRTILNSMGKPGTESAHKAKESVQALDKAIEEHIGATRDINAVDWIDRHKKVNMVYSLYKLDEQRNPLYKALLNDKLSHTPAEISKEIRKAYENRNQNLIKDVNGLMEYAAKSKSAEHKELNLAIQRSVVADVIEEHQKLTLNSSTYLDINSIAKKLNGFEFEITDGWAKNIKDKANLIADTFPDFQASYENALPRGSVDPKEASTRAASSVENRAEIARVNLFFRILHAYLPTDTGKRLRFENLLKRVVKDNYDPKTVQEFVDSAGKYGANSEEIKKALGGLRDAHNPADYFPVNKKNRIVPNNASTKMVHKNSTIPMEEVVRLVTDLKSNTLDILEKLQAEGVSYVVSPTGKVQDLKPIAEILKELNRKTK